MRVTAENMVFSKIPSEQCGTPSNQPVPETAPELSQICNTVIVLGAPGEG